MMHSETEDSGFSVAPLLGAAGAAVVISIATERFAIKRQTAALGGSAIAFAVSRATSGTVRALFQGAALAGVGLAIVELVRTLRQGAVSAASSGNGAAPTSRSETDAVAQEPPLATNTESERHSAARSAELHGLAREMGSEVRRNGGNASQEAVETEPTTTDPETIGRIARAGAARKSEPVSPAGVDREAQRRSRADSVTQTLRTAQAFVARHAE